MSFLLATYARLHEDGFHVETPELPQAPQTRVGARNQQAMSALQQMMSGVQMGGRR